MDRNKVKRPRSSTPTKGEKQSGGSPPFKKKSKTGISAAAAAASSSPFGTTKKDKASKKPKRIRSESEGAAGVAGPGASTLKLKKSSGSSTATADGQMMAQMLTTFSKLEESRFEAFQRSSFQADAIERFVAACVCHRYYGVSSGGGDAGGGAPTRKGGAASKSRRARPLEDLVSSPGPSVAQDIVTVVSTLAKIYAQRLAAAAVQVSQQRWHQQQQQKQPPRSDDDSPSRVGNGQRASVDRPLEPEDVLEAYRLRAAAGLDPGFYLQPHDGISAGSIAPPTPTAAIANLLTSTGGSGGGGEYLGLLGQNHSNHLGEAAVLEQHRRLAALAAQDEYDKSRTADAAGGATVANVAETEREGVDQDERGNVDDMVKSDERDQSQQDEDVVMKGTTSSNV